MKPSLRLAPCLITALLALGVVAASPVFFRRPTADATPAEPGVGTRVKEFRLRDDSGRVRTLAEFKSSKALVLVFIGTSCPVANGYAEVLRELAQRYAPRGAQFLGVNANEDEDLAAVAAHAREYRFGFPVLKDEKQALADRVGARVTPEVFVLDAARAVRYRGRIDDGYVTRTRKSPEPKRRDLEEALEAVLAGKPVPTPVTTALGCEIPRPRRVASSGKVTYHRDVAPILQRRCQSCHRPGQVAPFSLLTYKEARSWATEIRTFTANRQMPPWLAEPGFGEFEDVRRLSDEEIGTLSAWVNAGAPEGNRKQAPPARTWSDEWMLGKPDLVLEPSEPYEVAASGDDDFRVFVLPTGLTEDKQVVAVDFKPGNPRVVHHLVSFVDTSGKGRELDAAEPGPGYSSGLGGIKIPEAAIQGVWAPGNLPRFLPPGVGRPLPKNGDIVLQVHYHKTGKPETDRPKVALYFASEPVKQAARTALVGPFDIDIPAGAANHEHRFMMTLRSEMRVLNIMPHMHLLGKELKVTALLPDGARQELVWVRAWDYRWQDSYRYKEPLRLPAGTKIELVAHFDNSAANPRNPSSPPRRVQFGEQTTDEMAFAIMEVVPETASGKGGE